MPSRKAPGVPGNLGAFRPLRLWYNASRGTVAAARFTLIARPSRQGRIVAHGASERVGLAHKTRHLPPPEAGDRTRPSAGRRWRYARRPSWRAGRDRPHGTACKRMHSLTLGPCAASATSRHGNRVGNGMAERATKEAIEPGEAFSAPAGVHSKARGRLTCGLNVW